MAQNDSNNNNDFDSLQEEFGGDLPSQLAGKRFGHIGA